MAHPTRGHTSHTYDIETILEVNPDALSITFTDAAHASPRTFRITADPTPAARQILEAMAESVSVYGDGNWESAYGLQHMVSRASAVLRALDSKGISDFRDAGITLPELREAIELFDAGLKRTLNKLLGRVLRKYHPQGSALARALANTSYMVVESRMELYDDAEADAIQTAARSVFDLAYKGQRDVLRALGYDTHNRDWLLIPAGEIIAGARTRSPALEGSRQPSLKATYLHQIDWALLNPAKFGFGGDRVPVLGEVMTRVGIALYPPAYVFTAAAILHCLTELSGANLSVMLRTKPSDLSHTGESTGLLDLAKARNHSEDSIAVRTGSNSTLGGLILALTGLTRFARQWRRDHLATDSGMPEVADRLYVEHKNDPKKAEVITSQRLQNGWRDPAFDEAWPDLNVERSAVGLRFQALRRKALERAVGADPGADVHGHSPRTRIGYLANVLPEHVLVKHATAAQDDIVDEALSRFTLVQESTDPKAQALAEAVKQQSALDLVTSVCTNAGNDPDRNMKPCSLGLAACFTCPNGFRTVDHIPGLLATVRFTEIIQNNDPDEWEHGDASALHFYAAQSLKQFPPAIIDAVNARVDFAPLLILIHALYTEFRR